MGRAEESAIDELVALARKVAKGAAQKAKAQVVVEALRELHELIDELTEMGADNEIDLAVERLRVDEARGDQTASAALWHFQILLRVTVLQHQTIEGEPLELKLLPIALQREVPLIPAGPYRELLEVWTEAIRSENLYFIDPRPWSAELVFGLEYRDIAALTPEDGLVDHWPDDDQDGPSEKATLCFLAIWRRARNSTWSGAPEIVDSLASGDQKAVTQAIHAAMAHSQTNAKSEMEAEQIAAQRTARILGEMLDGGTVVIPAADDILEARAQGWGLRESLVAEESLTSQLNLAGPGEGGASAAVCMVHSVHGESAPEELGGWWSPQELRLSLLDTKGNLVARHAIRLAPWYPLDAALDHAQELAGKLAIESVNGLMTPQELDDDRPGEPVYFHGKEFLPHAPPGSQTH